MWGRVRMKRVVTVVAATALAASFASPALAKGPFGRIHVGQWSGGAYTFDNTGGFSHCAAGANYLNGVYLILSENATGAWTVGFVNQTFRLTVGETIPIELTFDGQTQIHLF